MIGADTPAASPTAPPVDDTRRRRPDEPQPFDFRRPRTLSRDQVRALHIVGETLARQFTTVLSMSVRSVCQISLASTDHMSYDEYIRSSDNPTAIALLSLDPLPGTALLQLPLPVTLSAVDRMLGGPGEGEQPRRALTDIENTLVRELLDKFAHEISYAFESLSALEARVTQLEPNPNFAQAAAPSDMMVVLTFDVRMGNTAGSATMCLPHAALQPALENVTSQSLFPDRSGLDPGQVTAALIDRISAAPVDVTVRFEPVTLTSAEILDLQVGDVLPLDHPVSRPLAVTAEGSTCAFAAPGRKGRRLAAMIVDADAQLDVGKDL